MRALRTACLFLVMILVGVVFLAPFYWMLLASFEPHQRIFQTPPAFFVWPLHWKNYTKIGDFFPFWLYLRNTVAVAVLGAVGTCLGSSLAAYSFARLKWPGRQVLFTVTISTMMLPFAVYMIPLYELYRKLGMVNSLLPLWAPFCLGGAYNVFLLTQFFKGIPFEFSESATIDGCNQFVIYSRIVLPLSGSALLVVFIFHVVWMWNELLMPMVFLSKQNLYTLAIGLQSLIGGTSRVPWEIVMAASTLSSLPLVVLYFSLNRVFTQGITMTGLKG